MPRPSTFLRALAAVCLVGVAADALRREEAGPVDPVSVAWAGLAALGFQPIGEPELVLEADQPLAWSLERSRPGEDGVRLARSEGGALRQRVRFSGGGEVVVTAGGLLWSVRRPVPTDPGPDPFPLQAQERLEESLRALVGDPSAWNLVRVESWRESGSLWYRARFAGGPGELPPGWRREVEIERAGSTVVAWKQAVHPLGTDVGVVMGRIAELRVLRRPALAAIALAVIGLVLAGAEAHAFHQRIGLGRGAAAGIVAAALAWLARAPSAEAVGMAIVCALAAALRPIWTSVPKRRFAAGAPFGALLFLGLASLPLLVQRLGGWMPMTPASTVDLSPQHLLGTSWFPAVAEEPVLRGAFPGLAAPVFGWWGGALIGAVVGALLHPLPSVPLVAGLGRELLVQLGMVGACRVGGVGAAILARGTCEALLRRPLYPSGLVWDLVALAPLAVGVVLLLRERRAA
ncbi:MAG: hypothetical protein ACOY3Y_02635 [Acidobacteriota bacterium]